MRTARQAATETLNIATGKVALLAEITQLGIDLTENGNISAFDLAYGLGQIRDKVLAEEKSALNDLECLQYGPAVCDRLRLIHPNGNHHNSPGTWHKGAK